MSAPPKKDSPPVAATTEGPCIAVRANAGSEYAIGGRTGKPFRQEVTFLASDGSVWRYKGKRARVLELLVTSCDGITQHDTLPWHMRLSGTVHAMRRKGLITDSGIRRQNVSGRKAIVWADGREVDYFGLCPECHSGDGFLNVGRTHVFLCHSHRVKWIFGANIFSSWRWESEADWERNAQLLAGYREVVPFCWPETLKAAADEYPIYENEGKDAGDFPF